MTTSWIGMELRPTRVLGIQEQLMARQLSGPQMTAAMMGISQTTSRLSMSNLSRTKSRFNPRCFIHVL